MLFIIFILLLFQREYSKQIQFAWNFRDFRYFPSYSGLDINFNYLYQLKCIHLISKHRIPTCSSSFLWKNKRTECKTLKQQIKFQSHSLWFSCLKNFSSSKTKIIFILIWLRISQSFTWLFYEIWCTDITMKV